MHEAAGNLIARLESIGIFAWHLKVNNTQGRGRKYPCIALLCGRVEPPPSVDWQGGRRNHHRGRQPLCKGDAGTQMCSLWIILGGPLDHSESQELCLLLREYMEVAGIGFLQDVQGRG